MYNRISSRNAAAWPCRSAQQLVLRLFHVAAPARHVASALGEEIIICDNCNRILYYVPAGQPAQTTAQTAN